MKILINSYNNVMQHDGGGIQMRIRNFTKQYEKNPDVEAKLFNKWEDKLKDYQLIHEFKVTADSYMLLRFAKEEGLKIVISSVISQLNERKIRTLLKFKNYLPYNLTTMTYDTLMLADEIIAQTKKEASFIHETYGISESKIHVLPNGVNELILNNYQPDFDKRDIVLNVGRFDHNKNQLSLVRAGLKTKYEIHFVGGKTPDDENYYDECVKEANGASNIHFHGWLNNSSKEFLDLYKRARVVTLLSHHEIFGNSLIEGAACGANLLSTNVLPVGEYGFDEHCVTADPNSEEDICSGLVKAYEMPLNGYLHDVAQSRFSWENIANQQIDIYKRILAR